MARQVRNPKVDSATARAALKVRSAPYWSKIERGRYLGYRRLTGGFGTWLARWQDAAGGRRLQEAIGPADDVNDADNVAVFSWDQAQKRARAFFDRAAHAAGGERVR